MVAVPPVSHRMVIYYAWSRLGETTAPIELIENRFPALFEGRRMLYPRFAELADPMRYDQRIGGFLDYFQRPSFDVGTLVVISLDSIRTDQHAAHSFALCWWAAPSAVS
jgi:hypothetical protein